MSTFEDDADAAQEELWRRMGLLSDEGNEDKDPAEAELADLQRAQLRAFLLRERKDGIDK